MLAARRVYIYIVSYIGFVMTLVGATSLLQILLEVILGARQNVISSGDLRERFSFSGAALLVGGVVWVIHWMLARRVTSAQTLEAEHERRSVLRKLMIYAVLITTLWTVYFALHELLLGVQLILFGQGGQPLSEVLSSTVPKLLVFGVAGLYYWSVRRTDNAVSPEQGREATVRRWYFYLVNFIMLSALMVAASDVARRIWEAFTSSAPVISSRSEALRPIMDGVAWAAAAMVVWLLHWLYVQRLTAVSSDEQHSTLRKVYLYGVILQTATVSVISLALLLNNLLRMILGSNPLAGTNQSLLTAAGGPVITSLVYGVFWAYHWRVIQWDASLVQAERPRQASIRRIYHYLVAIIGLGVAANGAAGMLRMLLDFWFGGEAATNLSREAWSDQISFIATTMLVGGPVWLVNWLRLQRLALAADGGEERQALSRRVYLYIVVFFSVLTLVSSAAWLLYLLFRNLGETFTNDLLGQISWATGASITAAVILAYHARLMMGDQRARATLPAPVALPPVEVAALVLLRGQNASVISTAVSAFRNGLPKGVEADVFDAPGATSAELQAWLAARPAQTVTPAPQAGEQAGAEPMPA